MGFWRELGENWRELKNKDTVSINLNSIKAVLKWTSLKICSRDEAVLWICVNQLGRRNLSEETRKFLIGLQYEKEKTIASQRNRMGRNQYSCNKCDRKRAPVSGHNTAVRIAAENHISAGTVQKYARYARALQEIDRKNPNVLPKILAGDYKISHENVIEMAGLPETEINKVKKRLDSGKSPFASFSKTREEIKSEKTRQNDMSDTPSGPSVKDMPSYDPDAEINSLCFTIPSWIGSIERVKGTVDPEMVSHEARIRMKGALDSLKISADEMLGIIEEALNGGS